MAKLPDASPDEISGVRPSTASIAPTDFGLGGLAQGVAQVGAINKQADQASVQGRFLALQTANQDALQTEAAAYRGEPGFATDQIAKARERVAEAVADPSLSPGQKTALAELGHGEIARVGEQAIAHEAAVRAKPIAEMTAANEAVPLNDGAAQRLAIFSPKLQDLLHTWDWSKPGYALAVKQLAADTNAQVVAQAPPNSQGALKRILDGQGLEDFNRAVTTEQEGHDAFVFGSAQKQAATGINAVLSSPLAYDGFVKNVLPGIVATMPANKQADLTREWTGQAVQARIEGLINNDQAEQAQAELDDGRYDKILEAKMKETLESKVVSAQESKSPKTLPQALYQNRLKEQAEAVARSLATTGQAPAGVDPDKLNAEIVAHIGARQAADAVDLQTAARRSYAATGDARYATNAQLAPIANAPDPDHNDPDYTTKLPIHDAQRAAAQAELAARGKDPGALAQRAIQPGDDGAQRAALWKQMYSTGDPAQRAALARTYVSQMFGLQEGWGSAPATWAVAANADMAGLAGSILHASAEDKPKAMSGAAALMDALPATYRLRDGTLMSPREQFQNQLKSAGLKDRDISALIDFGEPKDQAKLAAYASAASDPSLQKPLDSAAFEGGNAELRTKIDSAMAPFLATMVPIANAEEMAQARLDRTQLMARWYMVHQNLGEDAAVKAAVNDVSGNYVYVDGWRVPKDVAAGVKTDFLGGQFSGGTVLKNGMARAAADLIANNGHFLRQNPADPLTPQKVANSAHWVTTADDSGVMLMMSDAGRSVQLTNRYGDPVQLTWAQAAQRAQGGRPLFQTPPPGIPRDAAGNALATPSPQGAQMAMMQTLQHVENSATGSKSPAGALGRYQLMPATVQTYAPRLGLPVDLHAAQFDDNYNKQVAAAAFQDLQKRYGANGTLLAYAAYNAGPGRLEGYKDPKTGQVQPGWLTTIGDPRKGQVTWADFINRIPYPETRAYVQRAASDLLARLSK